MTTDLRVLLRGFLRSPGPRVSGVELARLRQGTTSQPSSVLPTE